MCDEYICPKCYDKGDISVDDVLVFASDHAMIMQWTYQLLLIFFYSCGSNWSDVIFI